MQEIEFDNLIASNRTVSRVEYKTLVGITCFSSLQLLCFFSVVKQLGELVAMNSETRYNANRVRDVVTL